MATSELDLGVAALAPFTEWVCSLALFFSFLCLQIRTSVNQLLCASKDFSWIRHSIITLVLLGGTNALVIFVPTIRDIFGFIGKPPDGSPKLGIPSAAFYTRFSLRAGASAAAMLIFILPSAFYIKLVKKESMKSVQKIGVRYFHP